jgi:hypothetical protein
MATLTKPHRTLVRIAQTLTADVCHTARQYQLHHEPPEVQIAAKDAASVGGSRRFVHLMADAQARRGLQKGSLRFLQMSIAEPPQPNESTTISNG